MKNPTEEYVRYTREELRRLQHWFQGFEAAGGKLPPSMNTFDCLNKAVKILDDNFLAH